MIFVCIPSRGLVHSRTMEDVLNAMSYIGLTTRKDGRRVALPVMAHGLPIPDCFNAIVSMAMADATDDDYIMIIEDDMGLPPNIIEELLLAKADIALADYPVRNLPTVKRDSKGNFQYGGLGCVLIKPWVFKALDKPWFSVEREYIEQDDKLVERPSRLHHGGQEIDFYQRVLKLDPKPSIAVIDTPLVHYNLVKPELPKYGNDSAKDYKVEIWKLP